ncbi:DMT family transporter [Bordetella muralis]|jgi:drug/metabolite transporter (DMT)-like permease|uniref:DMT family transporter n=1 Tax=Bordetella muralis TaxID=1649130 RepID=UPI0039EE23B2
MPANALPRRTAILLLAVVIGAWGINWTVGKAVLHYLPPIWATALRMVPACVALWALCLASGRLTIPVRGDVPVILSVGLLHMVAFSVLASIGLQYLPAGRSVVLAYTTPLWVLPAARIFLGEAFTVRRGAGLFLGVAGLVVLLQPAAVDWTNNDVLLGHGLILLAAACWAACIVYGRAHRWITPPFQLLPWQTLLAGVTQLALAFFIEGTPPIPWSMELVALLGYSSLIGTVLAYWAMNTVNRGLPASVTSMALLGVPVVGLLGSSVLLGERPDAILLLATGLIVAGVALGTFGGISAKVRP